MATIKVYRMPLDGGNGSYKEGCASKVPDCIPTASHLHTASRHTDEAEDLFDILRQTGCFDTTKLNIGDKIVLPRILPARSSLQSLEWKLWGEPGLSFSTAWEKTFAPELVATERETVDANNLCVKDKAAIPASYEATKQQIVYVQRFDTNGVDNYNASGNVLVLTVTAVPAASARTDTAHLQMRMNYNTHGNCNMVVGCPCADCGSDCSDCIVETVTV
jgi:hypothetical protein